MEPKIISTKSAPQAIGPYSQAIQAGNLLFVSGQIALDPASGEVQKSDFAAQCHLVLNNLKAVLEAGGSSVSQLVKVQVYLKDMNCFQEFNGIYEEHMQGHKPARACVEVSRLPKDVDVEVDGIAICS